MLNFKEIDSYNSWRFIKLKIDSAVKRGELSREKAHSVLKKARISYGEQHYNKAIEKVK